MSIDPATEEILRTFASSALPTIWWDEPDQYRQGRAEGFQRHDLVGALVIACKYIRMLEARVARLEQFDFH